MERVTFEEFIENTEPGRYEFLELVITEARESFSHLPEVIEFYRLDNGEYRIQLLPQFEEYVKGTMVRLKSDYPYILRAFKNWGVI